MTHNHPKVQFIICRKLLSNLYVFSFFSSFYHKPNMQLKVSCLILLVTATLSRVDGSPLLDKRMMDIMELEEIGNILNGHSGMFVWSAGYRRYQPIQVFQQGGDNANIPRRKRSHSTRKKKKFLFVLALFLAKPWCCIRGTNTSEISILKMVFCFLV